MFFLKYFFKKESMDIFSLAFFTKKILVFFFLGYSWICYYYGGLVFLRCFFCGFFFVFCVFFVFFFVRFFGGGWFFWEVDVGKITFLGGDVDIGKITFRPPKAAKFFLAFFCVFRQKPTKTQISKSSRYCPPP